MSPSISQRALGIKDMPEREQAEHRGPPRLVTDDEVGNALRWLATNAKDIGEARRAMVKAERMLQHTEAIEMLRSDAKSADARKAEARASQKWLDAANEEAETAGHFETQKALREAAAMKVEAWRSEQASLRAVKA